MYILLVFLTYVYHNALFRECNVCGLVKKSAFMAVFLNLCETAAR